MKVWLGVIGRACLEFVIILVIISFTAGASLSIGAPAGDFGALYRNSTKAALDLVPLAAVFTLFLAFFSFEIRVKSRAAGWLGLLLLGAILMSFGLGIRRMPLLRDTVSTTAGGSSKPLSLVPPGMALQQGRVALWIGAYADGEARDAVAVDFGSDYPRLAYASRAPVDASNGEIDIQGRSYKASLPIAKPVVLVPEASFFSGSWIWDRLDSMDRSPFASAAFAAGGFLLLAIGFRFICRITGWPLANALFAAAGLAGLVALDALLSGGSVMTSLESMARRIRLPLSGSALLACIEGAIGLILGAAELASSPRGRGRSDE